MSTIEIAKKRNQYPEITAMNVLLCLLVMFIHGSSVALTEASRDSFPYFLLLAATRSSAFVVQGFVFLSAFKLFCSDQPKKYMPYLLDKCKKIYLPYLLWNGIYYLNFVEHGYFPFRIQDYLEYCLWGTLSSPFYFVVFIMQFYLLMPVWWYLYRKISPLWLIPFSAIISLFGADFMEKIAMLLQRESFPYLDRIFFTYLLYWTLGAYTGLHRDTIYPKLSSCFRGIVCIFLPLFFLNILFYYKIRRFGEVFPYTNQVLQLYCVAAIYVLLVLCQKIGFHKQFQILSTITFPVYLNHCFVLFYVDYFMNQYEFSSLSWAYLCRLGSLYTVTLSLNLLYSYCRIRWRKKSKPE